MPVKVYYLDDEQALCENFADYPIFLNFYIF